MNTSKFNALAASIAIATTLTGCGEKQNFTYTEEEAVVQDITTSVTATGTIEPVTKVEVGTQVSGIVSKIYVDYNSTVKAGQVIAELDRTNLISELTSAKANLESGLSNLKYQQSNFERYKNLYDKGLVSTNDYDQARLTYVQAEQQVNTQRQTVKKAETNLGYATITSPIDGVVLSKEVEEGQTVASSFNTPTLFTIAQDLTDMRVIADVDEADIGEVEEGQRVTFTVDAFPNDTFNGLVTQVRQQATTESNVVTYEVVISAPNDDLKLKPGLTANVVIFTMELNGVLTIPNKALHFKPSEVMLGDGETITDCEAAKKVWVKEGSNIKAIAVETGVTNGTLTQVTKGLSKGTKVITEVVSDGPSMDDNAGQEQAKNPFMPQPRNRNKRK